MRSAELNESSWSVLQLGTEELLKQVMDQLILKDQFTQITKKNLSRLLFVVSSHADRFENSNSVHVTLDNPQTSLWTVFIWREPDDDEPDDDDDDDVLRMIQSFCNFGEHILKHAAL